MAKVLFVVTGASYWTLKDGTRHPTGYWAEEFAAPYRELTRAGHEVVVATPNGVVPHVDVMSLRPSMAGSEKIAGDVEDILRSAEELRRPIELADARPEDYDAVSGTATFSRARIRVGGAVGARLHERTELGAIRDGRPRKWRPDWAFRTPCRTGRPPRTSRRAKAAPGAHPECTPGHRARTGRWLSRRTTG